MAGRLNPVEREAAQDHAGQHLYKEGMGLGRQRAEDADCGRPGQKHWLEASGGGFHLAKRESGPELSTPAWRAVNVESSRRAGSRVTGSTQLGVALMQA